jgi:hypothetical protein
MKAVDPRGSTAFFVAAASNYQSIFYILLGAKMILTG